MAIDDEAARSARARERFAEGVAHAAEQRWARAIEAFEAALALRSAPAILYNLAAAQVESGLFRDAHGHLLALEADPATPENLAALARELRARIEREAGRLRIRRGEALADAEVVLDTLPVPPAILDTEIPVGAGPHQVAATRGARMVASASVTASAGAVTDVLLDAEPEEPEDPAEPAPASRSIVEEPALWLGIGGAVLVVAAVVVVASVLATDAGGQPIEGNFTPGVITWP